MRGLVWAMLAVLGILAACSGTGDSEAPVAAFTVDAHEGTAPLTVQFTDTSSGAVEA